MKKISLAFIIFSTIFSCTEDIEYSNPAFQGLRNSNTLWEASFHEVIIDEHGFLTLSGSNTLGSLALTVPSVAVGTYTLGDVDSMKATYQEGNIQYSTLYTGSGVGSIIYPSDGEITITEIDFSAQTFTGSFRFNAYDNSGLNTINFIEGVFYQLPLTSGTFPAVIYTCLDAQNDSANALSTFNGTDLMDSATYETNCNAYKAALLTEMTYCGDLDGTIQAKIDALTEDCKLPCSQARLNKNIAKTTFEVSVVIEYIANCNNYKFFLEEEIEFCGDPSGSIKTIIDGLNCDDDDMDGIPTVYEDIDTDGNFNNDDTDMDTIANYLDDDDDGDNTLTINEDLDMDSNPTNDDTDGDGVANYLDNDDDGDSVFSLFEDINADGDNTNDDTDTDGTPDYLDDDDDGDGILTIDENPDPNGDGDPADALDTDADGIPDYLDNT